MEKTSGVFQSAPNLTKLTLNVSITRWPLLNRRSDPEHFSNVIFLSLERSQYTTQKKYTEEKFRTRAEW